MTQMYIHVKPKWNYSSPVM